MRLRVKDIDFARSLIVVREGKGSKDRVTMLPERLKEPLRLHLKKIKHIHDEDLHEGYGETYLPDALKRKYPNAPRQWHWQYVFPAPQRSLDPASNAIRRHHIDESAIQRAVKKALTDSKIEKQGSCHTFRHSFATNLLEKG